MLRQASASRTPWSKRAFVAPARGADVVIGILDVTGRNRSRRWLRGSSVHRPSRTAAGIAEMDVPSLRQRRPQVVLVDDLAHRIDEHSGRWELVEQLLADGIDVITTVNISNLESMGDIVAGIVGSPSTETVPDSVVRAADQIELVDMSPEALRRRLAHGHVYPPDHVDTALANLFRPEVLGRLRQLTLLWLADRVEEQIERQLLTDADETRGVRERVVVALGGQGGDHLVRRAARIAGRTGGHLVGVHVVSPGQSAWPRPGTSARPAGRLSAASIARSSATTSPRRSPRSRASSRPHNW